MRAVPGWSTVALRQGAWRVFTLVDEGRVIQVEHPMQVRQAMAVRMALRTLLPWLVAMPVLGGLLWWRIGHSLQPLTAVAQALSTRTPHALDLPGHRAAAGIQRLVTVLNDLLQRTAAALATQREFIADAAHALRTPLAAVHLQAHLVTQASEEAERGEAIATYNAVSNAPRTSCRSCSRSPTWSPWPPTSPCTLWPSIQSSMQSLPTMLPWPSKTRLI